ncbi:MAG: hypothetical protein JXB13_20635 [Phycisphaerae bacterium]|nr:hypothetical protein [Phycisphaerae bacterium]
MRTAPPVERPIDDLFTTIEQHGGDYSPEVIAAWDALAMRLSQGDAPASARLRAIAVDNSRPFDERCFALKLACRIADEDLSAAIIAIVSGWTTQARDVKSEQDLLRALEEICLTHAFVKDMLPTLPVSEVRWEELLEALDTVLTAPAFRGFRGWGGPARFVATSPAPLELRRRVAMSVLSAGNADEPLIEILDDSCATKLRVMLRDERFAEGINPAVAAALAHLGDMESLPILREHGLDHLARRIEVQHPPTALLECIASPDLDNWASERIWAFRRAVDLGVDHPRLRDAILRCEKRNALTVPGEVKREGIAKGVLRPTDLPLVRVPTGPLAEH